MMLTRLATIARDMARAWLHASVYRTVWSLPLPLVLLVTAVLVVWLAWMGP